MTWLNTIHGNAYQPQRADVLSRVELQLERVNHELMIRKTQFEELQGRIDALPAGCHAYGAEGKEWHDAAVAEQLHIESAVGRAQADRAHVGRARSPVAGSPALLELSEELSYLRDLLKAPALQYLRGRLELSSPSVATVPEGSESCAAVSTSAPKLISHLPGITDPERIAEVRQRANDDQRRLRDFQALRQDLEEQLASHITAHGGEQALDEAAGQALSQRITAARDALQSAYEAAATARGRVAEPNPTHSSLQNLRDALTLYLLRAPTYENAVREALDVEPPAAAAAAAPASARPATAAAPPPPATAAAAPPSAADPGPGSNPALKELDRKIADINRGLASVTPKAQLVESLARNGGCASLTAQEAAAFNAAIIHRQVLSNAIRVTTAQVARVNEQAGSGSLTASALTTADKYVEAASGAKDRLMAALSNTTDASAAGLPPPMQMGGSASNPRIRYPDPTLARPASCTSFGGTAFIPLPELPRLHGTPASASMATLQSELGRASAEAGRLTEALEPKLDALHDRLDAHNALVQADTGRNFMATLNRQTEDLHALVEQRDILAQEARKAPADLLALNRAVNAGHQVVKTLQARSQLVDMADKAIATARHNAANGRNELVSVPEALYFFRGPGTTPLEYFSRSLREKITGADLRSTPASPRCD